MILGFALVLTLLQVEVSFARPLNQADLNGLEQSIDKLQKFFHELRATKQREFASQQHQPNCPTTTDAQLQATPQAVHIQDKNSRLVLQYMPNSAYQVQLQNYNSANVYQQWYVIQSSFSEYYYIANSTDQYMKVIAANSSEKTPLFLQPMNSGYLDRAQLWIFLQPGNAVTTANPCFMIMNAYSGLVWNVRDYGKTPGTVVQVYPPNPGVNEQFCIF